MSRDVQLLPVESAHNDHNVFRLDSSIIMITLHPPRFKTNNVSTLYLVNIIK